MDAYILKLKAIHPIPPYFQAGVEYDFLVETRITGRYEKKIIITRLPISDGPSGENICVQYDTIEELICHWHITASLGKYNAGRGVWLRRELYKPIEKI
jgi:hypothetical protein